MVEGEYVVAPPTDMTRADCTTGAAICAVLKDIALFGVMTVLADVVLRVLASGVAITPAGGAANDAAVTMRGAADVGICCDV